MAVMFSVSVLWAQDLVRSLRPLDLQIRTLSGAPEIINCAWMQQNC